MPFLLDSDILIDHLRGLYKAHTLLETLKAEKEALFISVISQMEIFAGIRSGEERFAIPFIRQFEALPVTESIAIGAGEFLKRFRKSHGIDIPDALIAATAESAGATLVTRNAKHYPMKKPEILIPY